ncbi:hypothetical protein BJV77DRAFT_965918 [Russula vinacea]|nr:hypothetical protein BJV77DRAFT_965918 [Russula vinacea]
MRARHGKGKNKENKGCAPNIGARGSLQQLCTHACQVKGKKQREGNGAGAASKVSGLTSEGTRCGLLNRLGRLERRRRGRGHGHGVGVGEKEGVGGESVVVVDEGKDIDKGAYPTAWARALDMGMGVGGEDVVQVEGDKGRLSITEIDCT